MSATTGTRTNGGLGGAVAAAVRADRERRAKKRWKVIVRWVFAVGSVLLAAWMFMLGVGVVHGHWIPACPTIGYGHAVLLVLVLRAVVVLLGPLPKAG